MVSRSCRWTVFVRDVKDLGGFQFLMDSGSDLQEVERIDEGDLLATSKRQVLCNEPTIDKLALRYECVTLGAEPRAGAQRDGLLATVCFKLKSDGQTGMRFERVQLTTPPWGAVPDILATGRGRSGRRERRPNSARRGRRGDSVWGGFIIRRIRRVRAARAEPQVGRGRRVSASEGSRLRLVSP